MWGASHIPDIPIIASTPPEFSLSSELKTLSTHTLVGLTAMEAAFQDTLLEPFEVLCYRARITLHFAAQPRGPKSRAQQAAARPIRMFPSGMNTYYMNRTLPTRGSLDYAYLSKQWYEDLDSWPKSCKTVQKNGKLYSFAQSLKKPIRSILKI